MYEYKNRAKVFKPINLVISITFLFLSIVSDTPFLFFMIFPAILLVDFVNYLINASAVKKLTLFKGYSSGHSFLVKSGDYGLALMNVLAVIVKADRRVYSVELDIVRGLLFNVFITGKRPAIKVTDVDMADSYREIKMESAMELFEEIMRRKADIDDSCNWIKENKSYNERRRIIIFLFRLSMFNKVIENSERRIIEHISDLIGIKEEDFLTIKGKYIKEKKKTYTTSYFGFYTKLQEAYNILGVSSSMKYKDIKKKYRSLAKQYHPDKYSTLPEAEKQKAKEKFQSISSSYDRIKESRGIK